MPNLGHPGAARLIVLARDGVINERRAGGVGGPEQWQAIPGSLAALARLHRAGWQLVLLCFRPAVADGEGGSERLHLIHERLRMELAQAGGRLAAIFYCPHHGQEACDCRRADSGLLASLSRRLHRPMSGIPFLTDNGGDLDIAREMNARAILLRTGRGREDEAKGLARGVEVDDDLAAFAERFLQEGER